MPVLAPAVEHVLAEGSVAVSVMAPPRKPTAEVEALYDKEPDKAALNAVRAKLAVLAALHKVKTPLLRVAKIGNLDWLKKVAADFPPLAIGCWTVYGSAHKKAAGGKRRGLQIDATNAFGTGEHPTTRGCLLMLERVLKKGHKPEDMLDIGCGSGILAMAFAKASKRQAVAVDLDPASVAIAQGNVRQNGLQAFVQVGNSRGYASKLVQRHAPYGLIMANIFARPLCEMAKDLKRNLRPGGFAILSGILNHQANAVVAAHRQQGLVLVERMRQGEWTVLSMRLPAPKRL